MCTSAWPTARSGRLPSAPSETPVDFRESSHAPAFSTFTAKRNGLCAALKLFMAQDYDTLVWELKLTNESGEEITCDVFAYVELSQFLAREENILGYYLKWNTRAVFEEDLQAITYAYTAWMHPRKDESPLVTFASDAKIDSFCCNRDVFCGNYRDERNPVEVQNGRLSNTNLQGGEPCGALHTHVSLDKNEAKRLPPSSWRTGTPYTPLGPKKNARRRTLPARTIISGWYIWPMQLPRKPAT